MSSSAYWFAGVRVVVHIQARQSEGRFGVWESDHAHLVTSEKARILTIASPGGFERLFIDVGVPALPGSTAPPAPDTAVLAGSAGRDRKQRGGQ